MKKIALILLAGMAFSCQQEHQENTLKGTVNDVKDGTHVYLATLNEKGMPTPIDTSEVKGGKFEMDLPQVDFQSLNVVTLEDARSNILIINENKPLTVTVYKDSLRSSKIEGGEQNKILDHYIGTIKDSREEYNELRKKYSNPEMIKDPEILKQARAEQQAIADKETEKRKKIVEEHPNSIVSVLILSDILSMKGLPTNEVRDLYNKLSPEVQNTFPGKNVKETLDKASATEIGSKAPTFSAPTPDGKELALNDALGKITIVDFWASWCKPCRKENPNLVKLYNEYHEKGLNILSVSLDKETQKDRWLKAIKDDGLTWQHVSNLKYWQDPIAKKYSVRSIPATFILDENGVIVAKNLRGDALDEKIAELLK